MKPTSALFVGAATSVVSCSAMDEPPGAIGAGDAAGFEAVGTRSQALVSEASAYIRTPAVKNGSAFQPIACSDCAHTLNRQTPSWSTIDTGDYLVKIPGQASNAPSVVHVSPFGTQGAECTLNRSRTTVSGEDLIVGVSCTNELGSDVDTRFQLSYAARDPALQAPAFDVGFAFVLNNAFNGFYASTGPAPTLEKVGTGMYTVHFPGLRQAGKGGNAQVTSWTKGKRCVPIAWDARTDTGSKVFVHCATTFNVPADADFSVSYSKSGPLIGDTHGYVWLQDASNFSVQKPAPMWNKSFSLADPSLLSSGMEIRRLGAGHYQVDFRTSGGTRNQSLELSAVGDIRSSCVVMETDTDAAEIKCVRNGTLTNSQFSLRVTNNPKAGVTERWQLMDSVNFTEGFGVGWGLMCAPVAVAPRQVMCVTPRGGGGVNPGRVTGPAAWPSSVRYVAVDNRDLVTARVLTLGTDSVLRVTSGNVTRPWPAVDNFATASEVAQPTFSPGGARLNLIKIVVVRERTSNVVMGLTSDNRVVELRGTVWVASGYPIPNGFTWRTISGTIGALYLLATDGSVIRSLRGASVSQLLPPLPDSLKAIGLGGEFVITNANANANGLVPCVPPKDSLGFYNCGDSGRRFYKFSDYDRWINFVGVSQIPLTNGDAVLTSGNPLTAIPSLEDPRLLFGDAGKRIMTFHRNARVYQFTSL